VFKKVSSVIQKNLGNLAGIGLIGGLTGFIDTARNSAQTNAAAAKLLNKSPLELDDNSPTQHLKQNPYQYGTVYYPSDVSNLGTGHYMIFDIIMNKHGKFLNSSFQSNKIIPSKNNLLGERITDIGKKRITTIKEQGFTTERVTKVSSGINSQRPTHTHISDSIILYTPPQVKTTYNVNYETPETGILGQGGGINSVKDFLNKGLGGGAAFTRQALSSIVSMIPGFGDLNAVFTKATGEAINPNIEMVFKSVPFRDFNYTFEFTPRNQKEVDSINKIISLFKFHMQPELSDINFFIVPSEFQVTYMYLENRNAYIPKISRCVLKSLELDQSPENVFTTFAADEKGAMPVLTKMTLGFTETEIMTKQKIAEGF